MIRIDWPYIEIRVYGKTSKVQVQFNKEIRNLKNLINKYVSRRGVTPVKFLKKRYPGNQISVFSHIHIHSVSSPKVSNTHCTCSTVLSPVPAAAAAALPDLQ